MKTVFKITIEDKFKTLLSSEDNINVFAENILGAIDKVNQIISEKQIISEARLLCTVNEDSDLEE